MSEKAAVSGVFESEKWISDITDGEQLIGLCNPRRIAINKPISQIIKIATFQ